MKIGLAIVYYQQAHLLPYLRWGLEKNADFIEEICVSCDEMLEDPSIFDSFYDLPFRFTLIEQSHLGNGANQALNRAVRTLKTDIVSVMAADTILPPNSLKELSSFLGGLPDNGLLSGPCDDIREIIDLDKGLFETREDLTYIRGNQNFFFSSRPWLWTRGANNTFYRKAFEKVQYDEAYTGRGYKDWDFALRWVLTYGAGSILAQGRSRRWHINDWRKKRPSLESPNFDASLRFAKALAPVFNHRYHLFSHAYCDPTCVNVGFVRNSLSDVDLPCEYPNWIEPASANYIGTDLSYVKDPKEHITMLASRLRPGGYIYALNDTGTDIYSYHGLESEPSPGSATYYYKDEEE